MSLLSRKLFGRSLPVSKWPARPELRGAGMSDWHGYAEPLERLYDYKNTYYHKEPKLDIMSIRPEQKGSLDFLISSEVFEHIPPPVRQAFVNSYALLKPGGLFLLTVPYTHEGKTKEHFPEWHEARLEGQGDSRVLRNKTKDGREQVYKDLVFHGGDGFTLELRVFTLEDILQHLRAAGFIDIQVHYRPQYRWGIVHENLCSIPITAIKPAS